MYALLTGDKAVDLAEFYIVSDVELTQGEELSVAIEAAEGECCDRCWNYRTTVGEYNGHAHMCKRCANALEGTVTRHFSYRENLGAFGPFAPLKKSGILLCWLFL